MPELSGGAPDLDIRLAEIDRRLREIQAELVPSRHPRPTREPRPAPQPGPTAEPRRGRAGPLAAALQRASRARAGDDTEQGDHLDAVAELHGRLLEMVTDLLAAYRAALAQLPHLKQSETGPAETTMSAGPFASTDALRAFTRAISTLPGVREVAVRGFEGSDRAIVDVELSPDSETS